MSARKVAISLSLILLLAGAAPSHAQKQGKKSKTVGDLLKRIEKNTKKVKFSKKTSELPSFKKPVAPAKVNLAQVKPPSRSTFYYDKGTNEAELEKITDEQIRQLFKLTRQHKTSSRRGELWLRLAELYVEKSRLIEYRMQQKYDEAIAKFQSGQTKTRPALDLKASQEYNKKSIQLYEWFLRDFPKDPKVDQALFFLGYNYFELEQPDKGREYYERLTKEHPKSPYIDESNFALGEYFFEREKWGEALKHYAAVAAKKKARLYAFSLYKTAWCQYKVGKVKPALASLEQVIKNGKNAKGSQDGSAGGVSRIRLGDEAMKDLVIFYAEAGTAENAREYFHRVAGERSVFPMLEKLAYYYSDTGNRDGARLIFRELITDNPNSPKAPDYQYQIVSLFISTGTGEDFQKELFHWIETYSAGSDWARAQKDKKVAAQANELIETTLRNHILQKHQTAQNSRVPTAQESARQGYELYFKTIRDGQRMDEMHFFYAELLFDMDKFAEAAQHYAWVTENAPDSKYFEKSALNTVLAAEKNLPKESDLKKQVGESLEPVPFGDNVKSFAIAADRYTKSFPQGENVPAMKYKIGALYYYHNHFDKALETFNSIIKDYPKSQYAQYSANLTLDIYNLRKDYAGLEKAGQEMLSNEDLAKSQVGSQVKGVLQRASFKKAQDLEAKKDFAGAALAYEEFAKKNAGGDLAGGASYNAAVNFERAGDLSKAIANYALVLADKSPKNQDIRDKSKLFMATLYEKTGQYQKAAEAFEEQAEKNPKDKESIAFLFNAAVIRDGMNSYKKALSNYQSYFDKKKGSEKFEALFLMAQMQYRRGEISSALKFFQEYYDARPSNAAGLIEAAYMVGKIHAAKGRMEEAETWYKKVIFQQGKLSTPEKPIGVSFAAECKYHFVSKTFDELRRIKIPANPAKQGKAVQEKLALLNRLKDQLKDVIKYDDAPWVVSSLALVGQAYQHMAASIYGTPVPKGLDEEGTKQYKEGIDKVAKPFQDEAIKNYEGAIDKAFKLEGYGEGLKTALRELNRLDKTKYPDFGEQVVRVSLSDPMGAQKEDDLGPALKARDEKLLVEAASLRLGRDQNDLKALNALAVFYISEGKVGLARVLIARALGTHANSAGLHNNLGAAFLIENKERQAVGYFRKALEHQSGHAIASANLGSIFAEHKDYARAIDPLKSAYSSLRSELKEGGGLGVANNYGVALAGTGETSDAKSAYNQALRADGNYVPALLNYSILLIRRTKDMKEGEKQLSRLKYLAEDANTRRKAEELESALSEN